MPRGFANPRAHRHARSSHLGYDCYARGAQEDPRGSTRCILRPKRIPGHVDSEMRDALPYEMEWPFRDHACAHEMIDCVYQLDVRMLEEYQRQYPGHIFGFEKYIGWAVLRLEKVGKKEQAAAITALPIYKRPIAVDMLTSDELGACRADLHVLRYADGDAWGRLTLRHGRTILARSLIELCSDVHHLIEHYPGRFKAFGVPASILEMAVKKVGGRRLLTNQVTKRPKVQLPE